MKETAEQKKRFDLQAKKAWIRHWVWSGMASQIGLGPEVKEILREELDEIWRRATGERKRKL